MNSDMQLQIQDLLDKQACEEVLISYGRTLDWLDEQGQANCFWPDAEIDYGFFKGDAAQWVPVVMGLEKASVHRWHMITNITVILDNEEHAHSECYGLSAGSEKNEQGELIDHLFGGRYLDEFEKRAGQWRISKRTYIADWAQSFPDGLQAFIDNGFVLNVLTIDKPDHPLYKK